MVYYHSADKEDLEGIKATGFLKAPVFVSKEGATPYNPARDLLIKLDLTGFMLKKDNHPLAPEEGYYYTVRDVPISRIMDIEYYWGTTPVDIELTGGVK